MSFNNARMAALIDRNRSETSVDLHFRVLLWIQLQRKPSWRALSDHFGCNRATAFRYLAAWRRATGQPDAPRSGGRGKSPVSQPPHAREAYSPSPDHPWNLRHDR